MSFAPSLVPADLLSAAVTLDVNLRVVAFCAATALLVGLVFALAPAWQATGFSSAQALASEGRSVTGRGGRIRELLVTFEVATAVNLLFGAGLLLRTLMAVESVDRGYRAESVLTMILDPPGASRTPTGSFLSFYQLVDQEVLALPGVQGVAWATTLPLGRSYQGRSTFRWLKILPGTSSSSSGRSREAPRRSLLPSAGRSPAWTSSRWSASEP